MNRSPLFYPMARSMDSEGGGAADLQTDVMRFMAILSLCLMAIFALVQSVPVQQNLPETATAIEPQAQAPEKTETLKPLTSRQKAAIVTKVVKIIPTTTPKPASQPAPVVVAQSAKMPVPTALPEHNIQTDDKAAGFTFRFDSDRALTELVARNEIGLYAITGEHALRMTLNKDKAEFWSASLPRQYHEMDASTVPESVISSLRRTQGGDNGYTRWGVTLPPAITQKLKLLMRDNRGGALIIGVNGDLRLEH